MKEIKIYQSYKRLTKIVIFGILMILASILLYTQEEYTVIAYIGIVLFPILLVISVVHFLRTREVLVINEQGFIDRTNDISIGFVSWNHVESIELTTILKQKFILVQVNHFDDVFKDTTPSKLRMIKSNIKKGFAPISITLASTNANIKEVAQTMQTYWNATNKEKDNM